MVQRFFWQCIYRGLVSDFSGRVPNFSRWVIGVTCGVHFLKKWCFCNIYSYLCILHLQKNVYHTGCSIKIQSHYSNHTSSHKRNTSKFKTTFIYYYIELSFEVYNSFLGQLAYKWGVIKFQSPKQKCLEKVHLTSLTGYTLNFLTNFGLTTAWFLAKTPICLCFDSWKSKKWWENSNHCLWDW